MMTDKYVLVGKRVRSTLKNISILIRIWILLSDFKWVILYILGKDSCGGDSGGPLMSYDDVNAIRAKKYLRGIVSYGSNN